MLKIDECKAANNKYFIEQIFFQRIKDVYFNQINNF